MYTKAALLIAVAAGTCAAQVSKPLPANGAVNAAPSIPSATALVSPVPLYPSTGVIPPALATQFIFLEDKTGDLILSWSPGVSGPATAASVPGGQTQVRLERKTHVSPMLYVTLSSDGASRIVYNYSMVNQAAASRNIAEWSVPVPVPSSTLPAAAVGNAAVVDDTPAVSPPGGWSSSVAPPVRGISLVTWSRGSGPGIAPNSSLSGASISSPLLPGFARLSVSGDIAGADASQLNLPPAVSDALTQLEATGFNQVTVLSLAPRFVPGTNKLTIVADFFQGISTLTRAGYLDAGSGFVKEATSALSAYLAGTQTAADGPASDYSGPSLAIQSRPSSPLESQIYQAMRLSLGI